MIIWSAESIYSQHIDTLKPKQVLILFSLESSSPTYENILNSIKSKVRNDFKHPVNFYSDFIGISRYNDEKQFKNYFEYYFNKYSDFKADLFISVGPNLYPLIEKYGSPFLDSIPEIFLEFSIPELLNDYKIQGKKRSVIFMDLELEKKIRADLNIIPDTKNIFVVTGISDFDLKFLALTKNVMKPFENKYNISYFPGITLQNFKEKLNVFPKNSIIFCPVYQKDSSGITYYNKEVIGMISSNTSIPVFSLYDVAVEQSAGGLVLNTYNIGVKIGEFAIRILNGEKPDSIGTFHSSFSNYMFDWKQLKKYNIDEKLLPEGSIILNREYTFFEEYYSYIIAGIIFIVIETILLIYLLFLYKKQKRLALKISEQENRYNELVDFNRLSELSELTASLSHQLNQPLTAILSTSQAAIRFLKNDKFDQTLFEEIMGNIVEDVKRASEIMNSLRGMIKKETREKKRINLNKITNDVYIIFNSQAAVRDVIVETEFDDTEPFINADPILIQQVILNFLLNALEALEKVTKKYKKIILKTEVNDGYVNVSVSDNGMGINENLKQEIFKPFFTTKTTGLGIGLAICKSIIEDHSGSIQLESNVLKGATFSFKLKILDERS